VSAQTFPDFQEAQFPFQLVFFPQKLSFDAAGMNPQVELPLDRFRQLRKTSDGSALRCSTTNCIISGVGL
jgi:hypothetical protein